LGHAVEVAGISREHIEAYLADLFARGRSPSTARTRFAGLAIFFGWLVDEGETRARRWSA
jgi:site-specific recombinase XerD